MKDSIKKILFHKHILVNDTERDPERVFEVCFSLAKLLNIKITDGHELATLDILNFASDMIGEDIPEPFYRGFPKTVRELSPDKLLFDQLFHYFKTNWLGDVSRAGHSVFEGDYERLAFTESYLSPDTFIIMNEENAVIEAKSICDELLSSSRPIASSYNEFIKDVYEEYGYFPATIKSKYTAVTLYYDLLKEYPQVAKLIEKTFKLSDIPRAIEITLDFDLDRSDIRHMNLKNRDRKIFANLIDVCISEGRDDVLVCYERRADWVGILHHLHYKPKCEAGERFCKAMREGKNLSAYSEFEAAMAKGDVKGATDILLKRKGSSALLRNLNYILSRAKNEDDINYIIEKTETKNTIILIQLLISYENYVREGARSFKFQKLLRLKNYTESSDDVERRKSTLSESTVLMLKNVIQNKLKANLSGKLGKVYIDHDMKNVALPMQDSTSSVGYGTLPSGSRLKVQNGKKLRAFTYWEKVNDVDLSATGLCENGKTKAFDWRTMYYHESEAITFSGDETSGYDGGSEYFDINIEKFTKEYPNVEYLVFTDSSYSSENFSDVHCTAGYMIRDEIDSGEVFEPATVESSFRITVKSTTAYLFALDLRKKEIIWLNIGDDSGRRIAATKNMHYLKSFFNVTKAINYKTFFEMLALAIVDDPDDADVIVSDKESDMRDGKEIIRSYNTEKVLALLNA